MKKRILALALAGTTAFSVFGGLNVFAADPTPAEIYGDDNYGYFYSTNLVWDSSADTLKITSADGDKNNDISLTTSSTVADLQEAMEYLVFDEVDTVELGKIYMFDFSVESTATDKTYEDLMDAVEAIQNADADDSVTTLLGALTNKLDDMYGDNKTDATAGVYGSFRSKVVKDFTSLKENVIPASDFVKDEYGKVPFDYEKLLGDITNTTETSKTSRMIYLTQEYDRIVDMLEMTDTEGLEDTIQRYTDILDARTEDEFTSRAKYYDFMTAYGNLQDDYEDATSASKLKPYKNGLFDLIKKTSGAEGADKAALKDALAFAEEFHEDPDYGWVDGKPDKWSSEYTYYNTIYTEAQAVYDLSKFYSYQSTVDAYVDLLNEAVDMLDPSTDPADWIVLRLETLVDEGKAKVESDYTSSSWKDFAAALEAAEEGLAGDKLTKARATALANKLDEEKEDLKAKTVPFATKNELKATLKEAKTMLEDMTDTATGSQLLALTEAVADAEKMFTDSSYNVLKTDTLISKVEAATAALEEAMTLAQHPQGWYQDGETWYYGVGTENYTGWLELNGRTYFLNDDGSMAASTWKKSDKGYWYYLNASGAMLHDGWAKINDTWYYFKNFGGMAEGWVKVGETWYYLQPSSGKMVTGWNQINGKWYYFNASGAMLANTTTPDGYKVDASGAWVK